MVFENGFEEEAADWDDSGPWQPAPANASSSTISREGAKSVRFQPIQGGKRSEFTLAGGFGDYDWNTEYWVGFSVRIIQPNDGFGHIIQHHSKPRQGANGKPDWTYVSGENSFTLDATSAGFVVRTATDPSKVNGETAHGHVRTQSGSSSWGTVSTAPKPYVLNRWYDFVLHFRLTPNNTGIMEVWMKDTVTSVTEKLVNVTAGITVYAYDSGKIQAANPAEWVDGQPKTPKNEQKIGLYYGTGNEAVGGDILVDAFRIWKGPGGSYEAVAPGGTPPPSPPAAPSNVTATADSSSQVTVTWTDNASDETGFRIQRKLGASGTYADTVPPTIGSAATIGATVAFTDTNGLSGGNTYFYQVRADKAGSSSSAYVATTTGVTTPTVGDPIVIDFNTYLAGATTSSGDSVGSIGLTGASNNDAVRFLANSANDFVNFSIPATTIPAGTYAVSVRVRKANSMGKYQMSINGSAQGTEQNLYSSGGAFEVLNLGTVQLAGTDNRELKFTCKGKDPASSNYTLTLDTITLSP